MILNRRVQMALGLTAVAALIGMDKTVHANTLEVTATVPDSCTVVGGTLAFGVVDPRSAGDKTAGGQIDIDCTSETDVDIVLDGGLHHGQGSNGRAMKRLNSSDYLDYTIYTAGFGQVIQPDSPTSIPTLSPGTNPITVEGSIAGEQHVPGGDYSDTVQITLTFN
jgi:spore coat protein U-like protein